MKAKMIKMLNMNDMENVHYGIQILDGKKKYYAKDNSGAICDTDKSKVGKIVREFNAKHNIVGK